MKVKDHFLSQEVFEIIETDVEGVMKTKPIPHNIANYYNSKKYISHNQDGKGIKERVYKFFQHYNLKYKKNILDSVGLNSDSVVLDYGCGAGEFVKFIEKEYKTYGYEPNEKARAIAKSKFQRAEFLDSVGEIVRDSLDVITLWHVFEHIEEQKDILELFYSKLKPKGKLIIAVPNYTSYDGRRYKEFWAAYDVPRHIFHFSRKGMQNLMNNSFWKVIDIKPLLLDSFYISMLSEKYKKSMLFWLKGFVFGAISNFKASKTGEFSSLIYIVEKR